MTFGNYIKEQGTGKKVKEPMIGYKVDFSIIKNISDFIKSWFDRYGVSYKQNTDIHVTIAQIFGKHSKDDIVRTMQKLPTGFLARPKQLRILYGPKVRKFFVTIELKKNNRYVEAHDIIRDNLSGVRTFPGGLKPHISLFMLDEKDIDPYMWNDITQKDIKLPKIRLEKIQLYNNKFLPEFLLEK